ncbi:endophilin-B1-like [Synchiropus splendidus]|uniref:endophilin-B1-like n=1 Tax=Synchiropus splendidus TaxID=270530 RepID=UPI00237ED6C9|nr:endophilin-B1-like [Synchiropus splendidus]
MDLTRLVADAGQFINRAVQYTGESLGQAERTELDPVLEELLRLSDATKTRTDQIISQTEVLLQPNPGARWEERLFGHLDWSAPSRPHAHDLLGEQLTGAGLELGTNTPYGAALLKFGEAEKQLGETNRKFIQSTNIHFLTPLRRFTEGEYRTMQEERRLLLNKRLDLDIAKTRVRKAHEAERESRGLNSNLTDDDYLSHVSYMFSFLRVKWLKLWAQEISQAEMELRICQSLFERQSESTMTVLHRIHGTHNNHMQSLTDFVEAQASYFAECNQHAQELQKQLLSIPAVLCSNNWQAEVAAQGTETSSNQPVEVNHITPVHVDACRLPDFDQDTWNTDQTNTQLPVQTNNNNNNIAEHQEWSRSSVADHALSPDSKSESQLVTEPQLGPADREEPPDPSGATDRGARSHLNQDEAKDTSPAATEATTK